VRWSALKLISVHVCHSCKAAASCVKSTLAPLAR